MQQYVVIKNFIVGEINQTLRSSQVVGFDGTTLFLGEQKFTAPGVSAAIRRGWLLATDEPQDTLAPQSTLVNPKLDSQALLDKYKVRSAEQSDSDLPKKQPRQLLDFSSKVISDADEDNVPLDEALPSLKKKKAARKALQDQADLETIPNMEVMSDGGEPTKLTRQPKAKPRNILDTLPLVNTKKSVPLVEPPSHTRVFGGSELDTQKLASTQHEGLEVLTNPDIVASEEAPITAKKEKKSRSKDPVREHLELAKSVSAEPLQLPVDASEVPYNWRELSFRERKEFVEQVSDVSVLKSLLLLEKGAVKKFIASKLETLSDA